MDYNKQNPLRVFTSFSGYDSQCMALDRLKQNFPDFDYELIGWSEIDKYAIQAHDAIYPQYADRNYGDISKIEWEQVPYFDMFTYSSPCQDFSQAGKQQGGTKGSGTRSSLLWECEKAVIVKSPKYLLMENVSALVNSKFVRLFNAWQKTLEGYGYRNYGKVLNAKDYGVPQNRERIFLLSIRDDGDTPIYHFPKPIKLDKRLKDILENEVDEKYYLNSERIEGFDGKRISNHQWGIVKQSDDVANAIMSSDYKDAPKVAEKVVLGWTRDSDGNIIDRHLVIEPMIYDDYNGRLRDDQDTCGTLTTNCGNEAPRNGFKIIEPNLINVGNLYKNNEQAGRIYDPVGISPTLDDMSNGGLKEPKIIEPINTDKEGNAICIRASYCNAGAANFMEREDGYGQTAVVSQGYRIRKLTERECFRLMDVPEEYIDKIQRASISRSQQYKMAGNSIVVSCIYHIFRKAFIETENELNQLTLF